MPSPPYKTLSFEVTGRVGLPTLRLPERSNPLSEGLKAELRHLLDELAHNRDLVAWVVTLPFRLGTAGPSRPSKAAVARGLNLITQEHSLHVHL